MISLNINNCLDLLSTDDIYSCQDEVDGQNKLLYSGKGTGSDFLGWLHLPSKTTDSFLRQIEESASVLSGISELIVVTGIGGSYLGARAVIDALSDNFGEYKTNKNKPKIIYAGQNLGEDYMFDLLELLKDKDYSVIVISKSGTTTEPAVAFRILKDAIETKYGKEKSKQRIIAVTDTRKGALKHLADDNGYRSFVIPDDVGGRYSVLTPVGLLPIASAGFDIRMLLSGAQKMEGKLESSLTLDSNPADLYAVVRNLLYRKGKSIEILASCTPSLHFFIEWWKQLYGESEGKEGKSLFPAGVNFTTDLHSMGQWIQEGSRNILETFLFAENSNRKINIPPDKNDLDGLNYLSGKSINEVNKAASDATMLAHKKGGVPNMQINIERIDEENLGELIYFFEKACAVSGYLLGINPFNQPGVEEYKTNMFRFLGKPGYK
ncbi:MAG: glucose-6-phosphate isomerase [Ignavibacteria bacterium]